MSPQIFTRNHLITQSGPPKYEIFFINIETIQNNIGSFHPFQTKEENLAFIATEELQTLGGCIFQVERSFMRLRNA